MDMKIFEKIEAITHCLEHMAWAWYDCETLPPWLQELSGRWANRWFWVNKWLSGEAQQLIHEMREEEARKATAHVEALEANQVFAPV
jgi:hypothetical protein